MSRAEGHRVAPAGGGIGMETMNETMSYPGLQGQPDHGATPGRLVRTVRRFLRAQFGRPEGVWGSVAGRIMARTPSNNERIQWTLELLDIKPSDRILEIGFGPGVAIALASKLAPNGFVAGVDHSEVMVRQASKRNAQALREGRARLLLGSATTLPRFDAPFDKIFTINSIHFWSKPVDCLRQLRGMLKPGGLIAVTVQPRSRARRMRRRTSLARTFCRTSSRPGSLGADWKSGAPSQYRSHVRLESTRGTIVEERSLPERRGDAVAERPGPAAVRRPQHPRAPDVPGDGEAGGDRDHGAGPASADLSAPARSGRGYGGGAARVRPGSRRPRGGRAAQWPGHGGRVCGSGGRRHLRPPQSRVPGERVRVLPHRPRGQGAARGIGAGFAGQGGRGATWHSDPRAEAGSRGSRRRLPVAGDGHDSLPRCRSRLPATRRSCSTPRAPPRVPRSCH